MSDSSRSPEIVQFVKLPAKKIVCAVSGGLDSMLLLARCALHPFPVVAAHVNYGRRGKESDADEQLVTDYCKGLGIPFFVHYAAEAELRGNFQQQARNLRYRFLEEVRKATGSDLIATAHQADDHRESLLMQLFRTGETGAMRGIFPEKGALIRPMLHLSRAQIRRMAEAFQLVWREDASNADRDYTRNRLRHEIIPALDEMFPGWAERFEQKASQNQQSDALIERILQVSSGPQSLKLSAFMALNAENRKLLLSAWMMKEAGFHPAAEVLQQLDQLRDKQKGRRLHAGKGVEVIREADALFMEKAGAQQHADEVINLESPVHITDSVLNLSGFKVALSIGVWQGAPQSGALEIRLEALKFLVQIRRWRPGDRMRPFGMKGSKLISDILTDHKLPNIQKKDALVLQSFDGDIAAVIFPPHHAKITGRIAEAFSCKANSDKTLIIKHIC